MKKFLFILLICTKIIEIIYAGKNDDVGPSKGKGKRKLDKYLEEQNPSNSNECSQKSAKSPKHQFDLNKIPDDGFDMLRMLASTIDENVQHSSSAQQNSPSKNNIAINNQQMEQNEKYNIQQIIAESSSNPTTDDHINQSNIEPILPNQSQRRHVCPKCGWGFKLKADLTQHLAKKNPCDRKGGGPFVCEHCGKGFTRDLHLTRHQLKKIPCIEQIVRKESEKGPMN